MSSPAFVSAVQLALSDSTAYVILVLLMTTGVAGMSIRNMFESVLSEEDEESGGEDRGDEPLGSDDLGGEIGGEPLTRDDGDDIGGMGGLDADDLGGFEDDQGIGGGSNTDELEHRLDELEKEVGSMSSTVNTVRTENEQIAGSVQEVEENVRKLLDIYEMVTRGVNPFADDLDSGMGLGGDDGSFGLFADEEASEDEIHDDITDADAEGFFDEDLVEDEDLDDVGSDIGDVMGEHESNTVESEGFQDSFQEDFGEGPGGFVSGDELDDSPSQETEASDDGGTSFEELKEEYESDGAEWADEVADVDSGDLDDVELGTDGEQFESEWEAGTGRGETDTSQEERFDEVTDEAEQDLGEMDVVPGGKEAGRSHTEGSEKRSRPGSGKPYLDQLPHGFACELIVVEWLEFMVEEAGVRETAQAISYYESIDWISDSVGEELQAYLQGFERTERGSLTIDHHTESLQYISQLNGNGVGLSRFHGGGSDGIQR